MLAFEIVLEGVEGALALLCFGIKVARMISHAGRSDQRDGVVEKTNRMWLATNEVKK